MDHSQEMELIARFQSGDKEVFSILFEANQRSVLTLALQLVRREDAALDVAQEVFLRAYEELANWRGEARLNTWLFRTTVNAAMERLRAEKKHHRIIDAVDQAKEPSLSPETIALQNELYSAVNQAVADLPPRQRTIITLKHQNSLKLNEIAELLGITEGGAKASYHKALMSLREKLRPWAPPITNVVAEEEVVEVAVVVQNSRKSLNAVALEIERSLSKKFFSALAKNGLPPNA